MSAPSRRALIVVAAAALVAAACADDSASPDPAPPAGVTTTALAPPADSTSTTTEPTGSDDLEVGTVTVTLVDASRPTPRSGTAPESPERTLEVRVHHPADAASGPFPLVVFSHGLGARPESYDELLTAWAASGLVVAAPSFPLSSAGSPGGPNAGDVENQPGDVSFVVDSLGAALAAESPELDGIVDADLVAAGGHSNGALTTMGLIANSCCRDSRIDAAIVIAGTPAPFSGEYDFTDVPPTLIVHGTDDALIAYANGVGLARDLVAPRGLLTIEGGDHSSFLGSGDGAYASVRDTTIAFLHAHLLGDEGAEAALPGLGVDGLTTIVYTPDADATLELPDIGTDDLDRRASATPTDDLVDGQVVTVTWSGFLPDQTINVVQCAEGGTEGAAFCDLTVGKILQPNPGGSGSLDLQIVVGPVGEGTCGPGSPPCAIVVNDSGLSDDDATIRIPITFAG